MSDTCKFCGAGAIRVQYRLSSFTMYRCHACGVVFIDPFLSDDDVSILFDALYAGKEPKTLAKEVIALYSQERDNTALDADHADYLNIIRRYVPQGRLLDVGCGSGAFLAHAEAEGFVGEGIEVSAEAARVAVDQFGSTVHVGKLENAGLPENSYDVITMIDFLEHVPNPHDLLREARRALTPEGILLVALPNFRSLLGGIAHLLYRASAGRIKGPLETIYPLTHFYYYTPRTIRAVLEQHGFGVPAVLQEGTDLRQLGLSVPVKLGLTCLFMVARSIGMQNRMIAIGGKRG